MGKAEENIRSNEEKIDLLDGSTKYITEQISIISQNNITTDEKIQKDNEKTNIKFEHLDTKIKELDNTMKILPPQVEKNTIEIKSLHKNCEENFEDFKNQLKNLEDGNKKNIEKLVSIEETAILQSEKVQYIETLRLENEAKSKEDLEILVKNNEQSIEELKMGFTENINNIMAANITINENFNGLHIKSEDTWKELEGVKNKHNEDLEALRSDISSNTSRIDDISGQFKNINNTVNKNTVLIT